MSACVCVCVWVWVHLPECQSKDWHQSNRKMEYERNLAEFANIAFTFAQAHSCTHSQSR